MSAFDDALDVVRAAASVRMRCAIIKALPESMTREWAAHAWRLGRLAVDVRRGRERLDILLCRVALSEWEYATRADAERDRSPAR